MTRTQSSVRLRSVGLPVCASALALCVACSEPAVLDLFPGAGTGDCSDTAAPGAAGAAGAANGCLDYQAALVHRYSFNTLGVTADDRIGTAHGSIVNAMITASGKLDLAGAGSDQYVNLPKWTHRGTRGRHFRGLGQLERRWCLATHLRFRH